MRVRAVRWLTARPLQLGVGGGAKQKIAKLIKSINSIRLTNRKIKIRRWLFLLKKRELDHLDWSLGNDRGKLTAVGEMTPTVGQSSPS